MVSFVNKSSDIIQILPT